MTYLELDTVFARDDQGMTRAVEVYERSNPYYNLNDPFIEVKKIMYFLKGDSWFVHGIPISEVNLNRTEGFVQVTNPGIVKRLWEIYKERARNFVND